MHVHVCVHVGMETCLGMRVWRACVSLCAYAGSCGFMCVLQDSFPFAKEPEKSKVHDVLLRYLLAP